MPDPAAQPLLPPAQPAHPANRVVVVGAGLVGATFAYTLQLRGLADEIVLIDKNVAKARGDALDMNHGLPFAGPRRIWAGDYADCREAEIVVIAAGVNQRPGETRRDLLSRNVTVFREIIASIRAHTDRAVLVVATNPVDVLSYAAWKLSGLPPEQVIGSGTLLDTARFRYLIGRHLQVDPRSVHALVLGEHGDSEVPIWSLANVAGVNLAAYQGGGRLTAEERQCISEDTRTAAYSIIDAKGATYYAIALALHRLCEAILRNEGSVLTVSTLARGRYGLPNDVYIGLPAVVGRTGVREVIELPLSPAEQADLGRSAALLQELSAALDL